MSIITVLKPRAQLIVIHILETLLWLSFIIMSSIPKVKAAPVVFEESMNMSLQLQLLTLQVEHIH